MMDTKFPTELSGTDINNINKFGKKYELRILLWRGIPSAQTVDLGSTYYDSGTGEYTLSERIWLKKYGGLQTAYATNFIQRIEYQDENGNWLVLNEQNMEGDQTPEIEIPFPVLASKYRIRSYDKSLNSWVPFNTIEVYPDTYFNVSQYISSITSDQNASSFTSEFNIPFTSVGLVNEDGMWNKNRSKTLPYYFRSRRSGSFQEEYIGTDNLKTYKQEGTKITVEIKFFGDTWSYANWIILSTFYARKWTQFSVSGESGWVAKTKVDSPLMEGIKIEDAIEKFICKKSDGTTLLQYNRQSDPEVITVTNENIGTLEFEPLDADALVQNEQVMTHCYDGSYMYYTERTDTSQALTEPGVGLNVFRARIGGEAELLGTIRARVVKWVRSYGGLPLFGFEDVATGSSPDVFGGGPITRYVCHSFKMAVDDNYLYIPCVNCYHGNYWNGLTGPGSQQPFAVSESVLYKLSKTGGWQGLFDPDVHLCQEDMTLLQDGPSPYSHDWCWSLGWIQHEDINYYIVDHMQSNYAEANNCIMGVDLVERTDGTTYLLMMVKNKPVGDTGGTALTNYWALSRNINGAIPVSLGTSGSRELVTTPLRADKSFYYCYYQDTSLGANGHLLTTMEYLDSDVMDLRTMNKAELSKRIMSLSLLSNGLYASGFDYQYSNEFGFLPEGIKQIFNLSFQLSGYNLSHVLDPTNDDFVSYPMPQILIGDNFGDGDYVRYGNLSYKDDVLTTLNYRLNMRTGELLIRGIFPSGQSKAIIASYDYINSVGFYRAKGESRLGNDVMGKLQEISDYMYFINEYGALDRIPFIESQPVALRHTVNDFMITFSENPDLNPESEMPINLNLSPTSGIDQVTGYGFTAQFDGTLMSLNFPMRLYNVNGVPPYDDWIYLEVAIANNDSSSVNLRSDSGTPSKPVEAPDPTKITQLISSKTLQHEDAKMFENNSGQTQSEYYWYHIDVSGSAFQVNAGQEYCVILRSKSGHTSGNTFQILGKKADVEYGNPRAFSNNTLYNLIASGAALSTLTKASWNTYGLGSYDVVHGVEVHIEKSKQELKSVDIIDSLNPNITTGYESLIGGSDTTLVVRSPDFTQTYIRNTDYTITYSGGKFWINFLTFGIYDAIVVQWLNSAVDILQLVDSLGKDSKPMLHETSLHGDTTRILRTTVEGQRLRPADLAIGVKKRFDMFPGLEKDVEAEVEQTKKIDAVGSYEWDDIKKSFVQVNTDFSDESKKFVLEFKDPIIIGTSSFVVKEPKWTTSDEVFESSVNPSVTDVPRFFEVDISARNFTDINYQVMIKQKDYLSWRLAVGSDYSEMIKDSGAFTQGTPPTDGDDIKTLDHFYLKRMNARFGRDVCTFVVYETQDVLYFVDENGTVIQDETFTAADERNPYFTAYPFKRILIMINPSDLMGCPLFPYYKSTLGPGYHANCNAEVEPWMSARVTRVDVNNYGLNAVYNNYDDEEKKFLDIEIIGHHVNVMTTLISDIKNPGYEHADAQKISITNDLFQNHPILDVRARTLNAFWNVSRLDYKSSTVYDPRLRPGTVVKITSEKENLNNALFVVFGPKHSISDQGLITNFSRLLQV